MICTDLVGANLLLVKSASLLYALLCMKRLTPSHKLLSLYHLRVSAIQVCPLGAPRSDVTS